MNIQQQLQQHVFDYILKEYTILLDKEQILINKTKPEFEGDYTVVLFNISKLLKQTPLIVGQTIGDYLKKTFPQQYSGYNIIQGFLNVNIADEVFLKLLQTNYAYIDYGKQPNNNINVIVEYSSPNTNKPLHLGHLRNNFLGYSIASLYQFLGYNVFTSCIVNDRGVHICKSMLAWQMFGNNQTPAQTNKKGDHFVGDYYVKFNDEYKKQIQELKAKGISDEQAEKEAPLMKQVQEMLVQWEQNHSPVINLWKTMNAWVYEGFEQTYKKIGTTFNKIYYESDTYLLGKDKVFEGLKNKVFFQKPDNSIWIDLTQDGLDQKLVLRADGTSVYITQDIGLAIKKYEDFPYHQSVYVVGDEQNYHFKVLQLILKKLQLPFADKVFHLSYGMVELPTGKMKSREGTVVDADDLIDEMEKIAYEHIITLGKTEGFSLQEIQQLKTTIALGALKFFLLKVDPKKKLIFNPQESIDFHGHTGPFIQYTFARISSVLSKSSNNKNTSYNNIKLTDAEKKLLLELERFNIILHESLKENNISVLSNYIYHLAKTFNSFYADHSIINAEDENIKTMRSHLCLWIKNVLHNSAQILGIVMPSKM